ncbi:MAG: hypothetical protein C0468_03565 [Planctomyces sp.]|nr:hypothetical protein [Planctomyces sp.]
MDKQEKVITEVKNRESVYYTRQLRDYLEYALRHGYRLRLVIRKDTRVSKPLQKAMEGHTIERSLP